MSRTALVAGASGLVGGHLLRSLLADAAYTRVVMVGRRQIEARHPKLEQRVVDFGALDAVTDVAAADDAFCCLGTTIKTAGSQEAFRSSHSRAPAGEPEPHSSSSSRRSAPIRNRGSSIAE